MVRNRNDHEVAKIIKGLEKRIANLEESDRSANTPNLLRTASDQVTATDTIETVHDQPLANLLWNDPDPSTGNSIYQEGGYSDSGYGSGAPQRHYGTAGYGRVWGEEFTSTTGWKTGTWGSY